MKNLILYSSPRKKNTYIITKTFSKVLEDAGQAPEILDLYKIEIKPCIDCKACQKDLEKPSCILKDDLDEINEKVIKAENIILSTPIYAWYCTGPMKNLLDRYARCMTKYYGEKRGESLLRGKSLSVMTSCGYPPEKGADLFIEGMKRYAKHCKMIYKADICLHDLGDKEEFFTEKKEKKVINFAEKFI